MRGGIATREGSSAAAARVPGRQGGSKDPARIAELKDKLRDEAYMSGAILRIATVLSARLTEGFADGR